MWLWKKDHKICNTSKKNLDHFSFMETKKTKKKSVKKEKMLKLDMSFEEAVKLALNTPKSKIKIKK